MAKLHASLALHKVLGLGCKSVIDFGCGLRRPHRGAFERAGLVWSGYELDGYCGDGAFLERADLLWASHVLEHLRNPIARLADWRRGWIHPGGWLAVTVPLRKDAIVGGHINLYNAGLLIYHAVLAGFDCSCAAVRSYGSEISLVVRNPGRRVKLPQLKHDRGDIERLAHLFPEPCRRHGFDGIIEEWNW